MQGATFLQDLAAVMIVAGLVTVIFHRLKQPLVLGYLLAGIIIGPFTPPFPLIKNQMSIETLADLGVIFLMFSLGLEFNLRKLSKVGLAALLVAAFEITAMIWVGHTLGRFFGWPGMDSFLFGCMLALTSSTIVIKSLRDRLELDQRHGELISAVSLFDDMFVIFLMVLLPGVARTGELPAGQLVPALFGLFVFLVAAVVGGLLAVPVLLRYVARFKSDETLLVTTLGLCFGVALLALKLEFSAALGAFLMGAIIAETRQAGRVTSLTTPLRDMFCAVFFVAIGMLLDPAMLITHWKYVAIALCVYLPAKIGFCALGAFLAGYKPREGIRTGTHMAQIGEFAFVLAGVGKAMNLTGEQIYPIVVSMTAVNAFVRPYLVDSSDRLADLVKRHMPATLREPLRFYSQWVSRLRQMPPRHPGLRPVRSLAWQLALNVALIAAVFAAAAIAARILPRWLPFLDHVPGGSRTVCWTSAVLLTLPIYVATFRKLQAMGMMLAELGVTAADPSRAQWLRTVLSNMILGASVFGLAMLTVALSSAVLPPGHVLLALLALIVVAVIFIGHDLNRWYSRAKFALVETWTQPPPAPEQPHPLPALLKDAAMETIRIETGPAVGRLIRELQLRSETGASIVAIERGGQTIVNPGPDEELRELDNVLILGDRAQIHAARRILVGSAPDSAT